MQEAVEPAQASDNVVKAVVDALQLTSQFLDLAMQVASEDGVFFPVIVAHEVEVAQAVALADNAHTFAKPSFRMEDPFGLLELDGRHLCG
jgi:hypothetical protein